MLPSTAIPSAPPNSAPVSEIAEAAPAFSGGAEPTIRSVATAATGDSPSEKTTDPATSAASESAWLSTAKPAAESSSPPAITSAGRIALTSRAVSIAPATNPSDDGSDQRPASSGDMPSTSCRYWAMKRNRPNAAKNPSTLVVSAVENALSRNSLRSISGSASRA